MELPRDMEAFRASFLPSERRLIRRDGVHLFDIRYWSDVLAGADVDALLHRLSAHQPDMIHAELARPNWDDTAMWKRYRNLMRG
ncbi:MAG: Mu transposase C-terminal domain-containing protein, partial [Paracoccaceae bacterium]